ncbi:MAG: hypothetical protein KAT65_23245 [Methanophagales archaeon]|nr:hypothetical protein [Methanophagales archaeon]
MNYEDRQDLLKELCRIQSDENTAPIKVGIGYTTEKGYIDNSIVIYDCAPKVISELVRKKYLLSLDNGHLLVVTKITEEAI